jgi:thioredoxin 1
MRPVFKHIAVTVVLGIVVAAAIYHHRRQRDDVNRISESAASDLEQVHTISRDVQVGQGRPVLVELGSHTCIPCRQMLKVLIALHTRVGDELGILYVDVFDDEEAARSYKVWSIPEQIFFDAQGKELFRHTGYWSVEAIVNQFRELGINFISENRPDGRS